MRPPHIHDFYELLIVLDGEIHQLIEKTDLCSTVEAVVL